MSRHAGFGRSEREHERARSLAAARLDGFLAPDEIAWLDGHLASCASCGVVAAELSGQHDLFAGARGQLPEAPRDLWARTAATIEAEGRARRAGGRRRLGSWVVAPLAGALVLAIAVSAGLLNGLPAIESPDEGVGPGATPIALTAGDVTVLSRSEDGRLEFRRQVVEEVCPLDAASCGLTSSPEITQTEPLAATDDFTDEWSAIISPDSDNVVVMDRGGSKGIYVLPLRDQQATATPTPEPSPVPATAEPASTATAQPSREPSAAPTESAPPGGDTAASEAPTEEPSPSTDPAASSSPSDSPEPTLEPTAPPTPESSPSVEVTPRPDGAIEIARDVVLVGSTAGYSPDGTQFAFSARPADGSAGPDVYVWTVGDKRADVVTDDHASLFSGWLGDELLVSRVEGEDGRTIILSLDDLAQRPAHPGPMWRPTVSPGARAGVWWDGGVVRTRDGHTWLPEKGNLVLETWPAGDGERQVLAGAGITDWQAQWDDKGTLLAVWTTTGEPGEAGTLSLYAVDPASGRADLEAPKLDRAPAFEGFSLRSGRLTWSAPGDARGESTVQVLAWDGGTFGRLEIPAKDGATVVR